MTSIFGNVLKIDSTKKICGKLQGLAAGTAAWATSVGNERGEILQCVLTTSESVDALQDMANGIMSRYARVNLPPPVLLYTDRDCCSSSGNSRFARLFGKWPDLKVRLDIWHYMRRFTQGCATESHPLYGTFMSRLSSCIFEWDPEDFGKLIIAKRNELEAVGVLADENTIRRSISKEELSRHCR